MSETRMWGSGGARATRLVRSAIASEKLLETLVASDPSILGERLIIIGRQVETRGGHGVVDLLAIDRFGTIWVIELKKNAATRGITSQLIGYGCWVVTLSRTEVVSIFAHFTNGTSLEDAFYEHFGERLPADTASAHRLALVATSVNGPAQRELLYLESRDKVVSVFHYEHFTDGGAVHVLRVWNTNRRATEVSSAMEPASSQRNGDAPVPVAPVVGAGSSPILRQHYEDGIRDAHAQVECYWNEYAPQFQWDFLPPGFLWELHEQWIWKATAVKPNRAPMTEEVFHQRLRAVAVASGDWEHKQASAPYLMTANEPLLELVTRWELPTDRVGTWGYRRVRPKRCSPE